MKKFFLTALTLLLALTLLSGCSELPTNPSATDVPPVSSVKPTEVPAAATPSEEMPSVKMPSEEIASEETPSVEMPSVETPSAETEGDSEQEADTPADAVNTVYARQIERYYTALSQRWDESTYFDQEMSSLAAYYYEGNALENVGFAFMDLNVDDQPELLIGAILNSEKDPLVFEIWTMKDGEPILLAQSGSHNRYYLQYSKEDNLWSVAYESENGAAIHAVYYLRLEDGKFEVNQGILFDAVANDQEPWFMAYDLDWDASNDTPVDEETADAIMEAERNHYTAAAYIPYGLYK